ncbi:MAG: hypothetical protein IJU50_03145 [Lachnospiraceae bacterium]|nr:hypothetical protein [Lachnospiraceae bacterium]
MGLGKFLKKLTAAFLLAALILPCLNYAQEGEFYPARTVQAANVLKLSAAQKIAIANSEDLETIDMSIEAKQAAVQSAIKSIKEKERDMGTFRWSPLFSFKFPTKPNESEAFEFQFKPQQLQSELREIQHKLIDKELDIREKVSSLYVTITELDYSIDFKQRQLKETETALKKMPAQVALGKCTQSDLEKMQKRKETLESSIASDKTKLETNKKKLGDVIGMDVSAYTFEDPYVSAKMNRDMIPSLVSYTLEKDQTYYEASSEEALSLLSLQVNYGLINSKYRGDIGMISGYVQQAINGMKLNKRQFKKSYDNFLDKIDRPWQGYYRILFIKFPKEWTKGALDGIRYVEDDPYILYQAALDYCTALKEKNNTAKSVQESVEDGYNTLIEAQKAYQEARKELREQEERLSKDEVKYILGEMEKEEYDTEKEEYESQQLQLNQALSTYSETAYNFDRITCGGASKYFQREGIALDTAKSVEANRQAEYADGATYTIRSIVSDQAFLLSINIPEGFADPDGNPIRVTDFELWCDNTQIGDRTSAGSSLRHLTLTISSVDEVKIRLYNGSQVVTDCEIDPTVSQGPLAIAVASKDASGRRVLGTYVLDNRMAEGMLSAEITLSPTVTADSYRIKSKSSGAYLYDEEYRAMSTKFDYISAIYSDFADLYIEFYDESQTLLYTGSFDTGKMQIYEAVQ